jgi:hypothetical protein
VREGGDFESAGTFAAAGAWIGGAVIAVFTLYKRLWVRGYSLAAVTATGDVFAGVAMMVFHALVIPAWIMGFLLDVSMLVAMCWTIRRDDQKPHPGKTAWGLTITASMATAGCNTVAATMIGHLLLKKALSQAVGAALFSF